MNNDNLLLKREVNNGLAYIIIFAIGLIIVLSMISYIKAKVEDVSNGIVISESN